MRLRLGFKVPRVSKGQQVHSWQRHWFSLSQSINVASFMTQHNQQRKHADIQATLSFITSFLRFALLLNQHLIVRAMIRVNVKAGCLYFVAAEKQNEPRHLVKSQANQTPTLIRDYVSCNAVSVMCYNVNGWIYRPLGCELAALVNKLAPCAWLSSGASELWRLRLRLRQLDNDSAELQQRSSSRSCSG